MSKVVYSDADIEKVQGITYRKLAQFMGVVSGATAVYVDGESEQADLIKTAYEDKHVVILNELPTSADSGASGVNWDDISGKPLVIGAGATEAAARTAIGAGTSSLAIGTTASTAAAGNHNHAVTADATSGLAAAANIQAAFVAMSTRVKTLEDAVVG